MGEHVKIEVLKAESVLRDCTAGKVYNGLSLVVGMTLLNGDNIDQEGVTFFDDVGDQVAIHLSLGLVKILTQ